MKQALVTGVTGFLGSHFIINLLGTHLDHAYLIVRGASADIRETRVRDALHAANESYREPRALAALMSRLTILEGDIARPDFGLSDADMQRLGTAGIDSFWHFAASLNFEDYRKEHIGSTNVDGSMNAVELAARLEVQRYYHVSTAYTCGKRDGRIDEVLPLQDTIFANEYEASKAQAERAVAARCNALGLHHVILRPSVVIGNSQTYRPAGSTTGLYGFIREMHRLQSVLKKAGVSVRVCGKGDSQVNFIPVDLLMEDVQHIVANAPASGEIFHLCSSDGPKTNEALELFRSVMGLSNLTISDPFDDVTPLEQSVAERMVFYSNYISSTKDFQRKLPRRHDLSAEQLSRFIEEATHDLQKQKAPPSKWLSHRLSASDGMELKVHVRAPHHERTVLLCNAVGMPVDFVEPLADILAEKYRVVTWESRLLPSASNDARIGSQPLASLERHVQDVEEIMTSLRIDAYAIAGWCTGARLGLALASQFPQRVQALVLLNGGYCLEGVARTPFETNMEVVMPKMALNQAYADAVFKAFFDPKSGGQAERGDERKAASSFLTSADPDLIHLTSVPFTSPHNLYAYARLIKGFLDAPVKGQDLSNTEVATLVMSGQMDVTTNPEASSAISTMLKNSRFELFPEIDHFGLYKSPVYCRKVEAFLDDCYGAA